jgi:hypothetical protein
MIVIEVLFFLLYYHTEIQKPSIIFCLFIIDVLLHFTRIKKEKEKSGAPNNRKRTNDPLRSGHINIMEILSIRKCQGKCS